MYGPRHSTYSMVLEAWEHGQSCSVVLGQLNAVLIGAGESPDSFLGPAFGDLPP